jgi:hypothetical protein
MNKTPERLLADSDEHLRYEIGMLQDTLQRLLHDNALHSDTVLKNAVVESCIVHARSLTKFIFGEDARTDDITSDDYITDQAGWTATRGTPPPILVELNIRSAKEIVHLTTKRLAGGDPRRRWPLQDIVETLHDLLRKFDAHAARDRLHPAVSQLIAGLRPPIEAVAYRIHNPLSTELETKPQFRTYIRTEWPR